MENLLLALFVLIVILIFKHCTKGFLSSSSILLGIIAGYIAAIVMGFVLPTTGVTADGVEYTKAWVLNWDKVADAAWFAIPKIMPVKPVFDMRAILPVMIMFIVTAVETVGDISGVMEGGLVVLCVMDLDLRLLPVLVSCRIRLLARMSDLLP